MESENKLSAANTIKTYINGRPSLLSTYLIFSVLYFPVAALYLNQGIFAFITLFIYSVALVLAGLVLIGRFVNVLSENADAGSGRFGTLLSAYVTHFLIPVAMFKAIGLVIWEMLPVTHNGPICTIVVFVKDLFMVFNLQYTLSLVVLVTLPVMVGLALAAVARKK